MSQNQDLNDELPCGGYIEEDKVIQKNMKVLSEQHQGNQKPMTTQNPCYEQKCCQESNNQCCSKNQIKSECQSCLCSKKVQEKTEIKQQKKARKQPLCKKCKVEPSVLIHKNEPICKQCILKNIEYKCRLTLQNTMKVTEKSNILICFSGGLNSICLVNILSNLKKRYQKHHLFGQLRCIHIQQQQKIPENYKQMFEKETGIRLEVIKIEQIFEGQQHKLLSDVRNIFKMFNRSANTADLLEIFRDRLIVDYAKKNGFQFIVKGLNGESIAGSIFKYFTKGIGGNVTELSSIQPDSLYHYPLRQHLQKQLQYYFYTLKCSKISLISNDDDLANSCTTDLDDHLNDFILNLQSMYSHTAPAITRTSQKIESNRKNEIRCKWCMLKGTFEPHGLCRKCQRIYECKNKNFDKSKIPKWLQVVE